MDSLKERETADKATQERMAKSPKPGDRPFMGFNTEEFLARVNKNEKINNILRSPTRAPNGVRQRSVYTAAAAPNSSRFNEPSAVRQPLMNVTAMSSPRPYGASPGYDSPMGSLTFMNSRSSTSMRNMFSARYPVAPPPSPIFNELRQMGPAMTAEQHAKQFPQSMPPPPFSLGRISGIRSGKDYQHPTPPPCPGAGPIGMANGTIQLRMRDGIRIDMTLDKAVRVLNQRSMVAIALSRNCSNSALIHPNGRILQSGSKVEIVTYDGMKSNNFVRYAKMWYKGVSFTSESCALIYLVDTAGTRTTTDTFTDLSKDYTLTVFYDDSRHGPSYTKEVKEVIDNCTYSCTEEGTEVYEINGFRITQAADGLVKLTRIHNKCLIRTSPGNGSAALTTPGIHCTASLGKTSHLFVRRNEKRMHFDGSSFIVRNAGHSAGFNESNLLIVY